MTASEPGRIILSVKNIEVIYDHVILVLKGVSLDVPEGSIVALLGANGAGKSTTLKAISNLLAAERGEVTKGSISLEDQRIASSQCMADLGRRPAQVGGDAQAKAAGPVDHGDPHRVGGVVHREKRIDVECPHREGAAGLVLHHHLGST